MSQALLDAFNAATTWQEALAAIKNEDYAALLLEDGHRTQLDDLPDDQGREQAIGLGVIEIKTLFGDFTTVVQIRAAVQRQIEVEHAKFQIIEAVRNASNVPEMRAALDLVETLNEHRQNLIAEWSQSEDGDVQARVAQLEAEDYTLVLKEIASHADNGAYFDLLAAKMMADHGNIFGTGALITALKDADLAVVTDVLAAFNAASNDEEAFAALEAYADLLLDDDHLDMLDDLDGYEGRQDAIGDGIVGAKALFGLFETLDEIEQAVVFQVETEHAKWELITKLDAAMTAEDMTIALYETIGAVHEDRQELIAYLRNSGVESAEALADALEQSDYTTVLAEIATHLENEDYMAELGARMLALRNDLQGGQFFGDTRIIPALAQADEQIEAEFDAEITGGTTGAVSEDGEATAGGDLDIADGDWGEDAFQAVSGEELLKDYGTFSFDETTGEWSFTIDNEAAQSLGEDEEVEQTLTVKSRDGTATETITVTVMGTNDAPVAAETGNEASGNEDTTVSGQVPAGTDVDGDALTYELVEEVEGLTFNPDGSFTYVPADDVNGEVSFEYCVRDANGALSEARTFTITVNPVNDAPVAASEGNEASGEEDTVITGEVPSGYDVDEDDLTYELVEGAAGLTFNADGSFSYVPAPNLTGDVAFSYRVRDTNGGLSDIQIFTITIDPVNDAPLASTTGNEISGEESTTISGYVPAGTDVDGDTLTYELIEEVEGLTFNPNGSFSFVPTATGTFTFQYQVVDDEGATSDIRTFTITVTPENDPPVASATQNVTTDEDVAIVQSIGATDPNEDPLTYSVKNGAGPQKGVVTFDQVAGTFTYTPADDENGTDTFTIVISDGEHSIEQVVTVSITPVNDAPVASSTGNSTSGEEDTTITG